MCMCVQNLKFVALPVPGIIGGTKNVSVPGYAHGPFPQNLLIRMDPVNVPTKFEVRSFAYF